MNAWPAEVDLALTAVREPGPDVRLVLRRRVCARAEDGREAAVEELWVSQPCPSPFAAAETVQDVLCRCGSDLVRGRAVRALPGLESPSTAQLVALHRAVERRAVGVEALAGYRGTVQDLCSGRPVLRAGDVVATDGFLGVRTRRLLVDVLRSLALPSRPSPGRADAPSLTGPSLTGQALDEEVVRTNLLRALADARRRLDQERSWVLLDTSRLAHVLGAEPAPGWSRAGRRTLEGAVVESGGEPDPGRDAVVVVFVGGRGGQVDLFRYELDPRVDLPGVLTDPPVRGAFAACAAHPGDSVAQTRAVTALREAAAGRPAPDRGPAPGAPVPAQVVATAGTLVPTKETLDGVVVLHDCRGVEAGNHDRRFNTFAYVFAPAETTGELLRFRPDIVQTIVDHSCRIDDAAGSQLRNALATAVCGAGPGS